MSSANDEFHANKCKRLKSFENTVKNIFDEKLNKFGDCFKKVKKNIIHIQIFDNYGRYYLKKVYGSFRGVSQQFDKDGHHLNNIKRSLRKDPKFKPCLYYTRYILFRTISLKNSKNLVCELDQDLQCLVDEEELRHYLNSTLLFRLQKSL